MKVKQLEIETFKPISIVLETKEELDLLTNYLGALSIDAILDRIFDRIQVDKTHRLTRTLYSELLKYTKQ